MNGAEISRGGRTVFALPGRNLKGEPNIRISVEAFPNEFNLREAIDMVVTEQHGLLRVFIDSQHGITVDDCARVSHQISALLDVEDPIRGQYTLEVSSPGLDRPLFQESDYERFAGREVQLRLSVPVQGRRKFKGILMGLRDHQVVVRMDDEELVVPLQKIDGARLVPDYDSHRAEGA